MGTFADCRRREWHGHLAHVEWRASTGKMPVPLCWPAERAPDATDNREMRPNPTWPATPVAQSSPVLQIMRNDP